MMSITFALASSPTEGTWVHPERHHAGHSEAQKKWGRDPPLSHFPLPEKNGVFSSRDGGQTIDKGTEYRIMQAVTDEGMKKSHSG